MVERPFGPARSTRSRARTSVSILVLVERPFGRAAGAYWTSPISSFNPCFGGETVWTYCRLSFFPDPLVSILVLVERPFGRGHAQRQPVDALHVSILVLVERPFGPAVLSTPKPIPWFQSLFWWRGRLDLEKRITPVFRQKFQSLFWWRGRLDLNSLLVTFYAPAFQSLFWWRGRLDDEVDGVWNRYEVFQSLFWWRGRLDLMRIHDTYTA